MNHLVRTFIAIEVPPELKACCTRLIARLDASGAPVKWISPEQMHWTLKFLGDVNMLETPAICQAVAEAAREFDPFDGEIRGAGAFPNAENPRTIWIGLREGNEAMVALHAAIERNLDRLGYRPDSRRFQPHLTLGRLKGDRSGESELIRLLHEEREFEGDLSTVYEVVTFASSLHREGPLHEPLGHAELGKDAR